MPYALRPFAVGVQRFARAADLAYARRLKDELQLLNLTLGGIVSGVLEELYLPTGGESINASRRRQRERGILELTRTPVLNTYDRLAKGADTHIKAGFLKSATDFRATLKELYPPRYVPRAESLFGNREVPGRPLIEERITEQGEVELAFGTGVVRDAYKDWIAKQMDAGLHPGSQIKTVAADHLKHVQGAVLRGLDQAESLGWMKDEAVKNILKDVSDPALRLGMENNVMRIVRTSYVQGLNADWMAFGEANSGFVSHYIRVADGRPCLSCVLLDGATIPGNYLVDHPYGMCVACPVLKTPTEMGLNVPKDLEDRAWRSMQRQVPTLRERFFNMEPRQQATVFGNRKLFDLWQKEKFPLDAVTVKKNGLLQTASARDIQARLPEIGSISFPKADFTERGRELLSVIDPIDRSTSGIKIYTSVDDLPKIDSVRYAGVEFYPYGGNLRSIILAEHPELVAKLNLGATTAVTLNDLPWWQFNESMRKIGLALRTAENGRSYFVFPSKMSLRGLTKAVLTPDIRPPVVPVKAPAVKKPKAGEVGFAQPTPEVMKAVQDDVARLSKVSEITDKNGLPHLGRIGHTVVQDATGGAPRVGERGLRKKAPALKISPSSEHSAPAYYRSSTDTVHFNQSYIDSYNRGERPLSQLLKMSIHEHTHSFGSGGWLRSYGVGVPMTPHIQLMEGFTETAARVLSIRYGVGTALTSGSYEAYVQVTTRLLFTASGGNASVAARILRALSVDVTKVAKSAYGGNRVASTQRIAAYLYKQAGVKTMFKTRAALDNWFDSLLSALEIYDGKKGLDQLNTLLSVLDQASANMVKAGKVSHVLTSQEFIAAMAKA